MSTRLLCALLALCWLCGSCGDDSGPSAPGIGTGPAGDMDASTGNPDAAPGGDGDGDNGDGDGDTGDGDGDTGDGDGDTGDGDGDTGDGDGDSDDDAGTPGCPNDCADVGDACNVATCNTQTLKCELRPVEDGTACGDQTLNNCTEPDRCMAGVCQPRHATSGTICGDQGVECHVNDACDGNGNCVDNGLLDPGTACGDPGTSADGVCNLPDTCDAAGKCQPNEAPVETPCGDEELCIYAPMCDGAGSCQSPLPKPKNVRCGPVNEPIGVNSFCHPRDMYCDGAGGCDTALSDDPNDPVDQNTPDARPSLRDGMVCPTNAAGGGIDTPCDRRDICVDFACSLNFAPSGTTCGPGDQDISVCDLQDTCNGFGTCMENLADTNVPCMSADECYEAAYCDGSGGCDEPVPAMPGTACGDDTDEDCNYADTCNAAGVCQDNFWGSGVGCGDFVDYGACDQPDTCDGAGVCTENIASQGTECGNIGQACANADTCSGSGGVGQCQDNGSISPCSVSGTVTDGDSGLSGVTVEVLGGSSTITDGNGDFTLSLPVDEAFLLRLGSVPAGFYDTVTVERFSATEVESGVTFIAVPEAAITAPAADAGVTLASGGVAVAIFNGPGVAAGDGVTLSATGYDAVAASLGGGYETSSVLLTTSPPVIFMYNVTSGDTTVTPASGGIATCSLQYPEIIQWPILADTATVIPVVCQ